MARQNTLTPAAPWTNASPSDRWLDVVRAALAYLRKSATLAEIYQIVAKHPRTEGRKKASWQAKIRQQLQTHPAMFVRIGRGQWGFTSQYTEEQVHEFNLGRREGGSHGRRRQEKSSS